MDDIFRGGRLRLNDLRLVHPAPPPDDPPLSVGDHCRLNSGSPLLLVVDADDQNVAVAWPNGKGSATEAVLLREVVRRNGSSGEKGK